MPERITPGSFDEAAAALREAAAAGQSVRIVGGESKSWGRAVEDPDLEIHSTGFDRILEHNEGDFTAVLESGVPLARAQQQFSAAGQMLALDPYLGPRHEATIGGVLAAADTGPLRHRYGAGRDLVLGMTVAMGDGTIARSGGKVIKNVAGYDIAKLFCGSLGTLGMILSVSLRLHPLPAQTVTTLGVTADPERISAAAHLLSGAPLELEALDVAWRAGRGGLLARSGGIQSPRRAETVARRMREARLEQIEIVEADAELWARQRAGQRSADQVVMRVAARPSELVQVLRAADECSATLVGRAALGHSFLELDPGAIRRLVSRLPRGAQWTVLDASPTVRHALDPWGPSPDPQLLELMSRVKARFDPAHVCSPGVFVGGI